MRASSFWRRSGLSMPRSARRARRRGTTARASPAIATFAGKFAPRTAGSMSTWIRSSGTLQPKLPVGISANRVPIASRQSQSANAFSAAGTAAREKPMPACRGCAAENAERPWSVVATGAPRRSAMRATSSATSTAPHPTKRPGDRAFSRRSIAASRRLASGASGGAGGSKTGSSSIVSWKSWRFTGISTKTGPGTPVTAVRYAVEDRGHDLGVRLRMPRPLRQALQDRVLVELVELVAEGDVRARAARDHEHGDPVEEGLADAAHRVRDARGRHDDERSDRAAARPADPVGREGRARLVRDEDRLDLLRPAELVVDLRVVHARDPERVRHGKLLEGVPHEPGAGSLRADPDRLRHTDAPAIVRAATRPVRTQLPRNVPSSEPMPWMPPPPKPAASPTA